jgi:hypothetical protein
MKGHAHKQKEIVCQEYCQGKRAQGNAKHFFFRAKEEEKHMVNEGGPGVQTEDV